MSASSQPLSPSERVMLAELLARAHGADDESEVPTPSSFAVIEDEAFHGMGEAAKRRTDEPTGESELKRSYVPKIKNEVVGHTPTGKAIILPQGVNDLASWGRTIIMFGKFAAKKGAAEITYAEVFDPKMQRISVMCVGSRAKWNQPVVISLTSPSTSLPVDLMRA